MKRIPLLVFAGLLAASFLTTAALAQESRPYYVGNPLGVPIEPSDDGSFAPMSSNVKVYGALVSAESCSYDPVRDLLVVPNRGNPQNVLANDGFISLINHDGSVHTPRWIGVQSPGARSSLEPPLVLNYPLGSDIVDDVLYVADRDGGTSPDDPSVAVIRWFDMETGEPAGEVRVGGSPWLNDIEVMEDGTIYASQSGDFGPNPDPNSFKLWRINPNGSSEVVVEGAPLFQPNGVAFDPQGRIVVVNIGDDAVMTFDADGNLVQTEQAAQPGNDGLVIMEDGTKYISSVRQGGVSRIRPGEPAELIAENIPSAASMCYDEGGNQLVIPMNPNNGLAFVPLEE
ncbi:MAG: SMP-30/gluconolactonase/LRE family protein [Rhodothermales bacterium]